MSELFPNIAIVGASGAVGQEAISILESRGHPIDRIDLFGSEQSAGKTVPYLGSSKTISCLADINKHQYDFVILCATGDVARRVRELLLFTDTVLIDNSSEFRLDADVPLVIPEVNAHLLKVDTRFVSNPNCSTIMLLAALDPLRNNFGVRSIIVTTYQAVSGAGKAGIDELYSQSQSHLYNEEVSTSVFPCSCAFNVFEHESTLNPETGFNGEETKIIQETRRIWDDPSLSILPTCVRVPVERAHSQSVIVEFDRPVVINEIRHALTQPGLSISNEGHLLTPREVAGSDDVYIGRIRLDPQSEGRRAILWICTDQIRKGAALNAIQIMDKLHIERVLFQNPSSRA
jgi:aspartate-semialdehyde dehydrogenase